MAKKQQLPPWFDNIPGAISDWVKNRSDNPFGGPIPDHTKPGTQGMAWGEILENLGNLYGGDIGKLLSLFGVTDWTTLTNSESKDWNKQLLDTLLQYLFTKENRAYNESMRDEQRNYDSPIAQLQRMMSAGVGRDAAIQALSGGQQPIQSEPSPVAAGIPPSQSNLNAMQSALAPINTLFGAASTIGNLASLGVSMPLAIEQANMLRGQNALSQELVSGLNAANDVAGAFSNLVSNGTLSLADIEGMSSADDALKYAEEHRETNGFKHLFAPNGSFAKVVGTKSGREMFDSYWNALRSNRDSGKQLDQQLRIANYTESLAELSTLSARRDYFIGFQSAFNQLLKDNAELADYAQRLRSGEIEISIKGEGLKQQKLVTKSLERQNYREQVDYDAFQNFVENGRPDEPDINSSGQDIINYHVFSNWYASMCQDLSTSSQRITGYSSRYMSPAQRTFALYEQYPEAAITGLVLQKAQSEGRLSGYESPVLKPLYQFVDMFNASGGNQFVGAAAGAAKVILAK